jgi:hypothetical protein
MSDSVETRPSGQVGPVGARLHSAYLSAASRAS